ncbi:MAG: response regulator [Candidatus Firestonebacteria bacterium]|nr:response regulator [Candidatus Firestonebacteria bacterium]
MAKKLILIVDDNAELLDALQDVLGDEYNLAFAANGREALEKFQACTPAAVLMDYKMPGMDGLETLRHLRHQTKTVPVIIMSAYDEMVLEQDVMAAGANRYISKPFELSTVRSALAELAV